MPCDTLQDEALVLSGLIVAAHAQVDRSADAIGVHGSHFQGWSYIGMIAQNWILSSNG
jgi:hypothetical protein